MTSSPGLSPGPMCLISQPMQDYLGQHGKLRFFTNNKGQRLAQYFWPAACCCLPGQEGICQPRAIIHLVHGHGGYLCHDYLKFYKAGHLHVYEGSWVQKLNEAGFSVCGIDNQGAGRSEGVRCYCDSLDDYVDNLVAGAKRACTLGILGFPPSPEGSANPLVDGYTAAMGAGAADSGGVPHFVLGASMGGCLATLASLKHPYLFSGIILLAAMLSLEKLSRQGLNPYLRPIGNLMSYFLPLLPCADASKNNAFPDLQVAYDADPNCWQGMTRARNAMEYLRWTSKLMAPGGMEQVTSPLLIFHGLNDDMCDCDGSKALYMRAGSRDKTLRLLENFWHVLTREPGNETVLEQIIEWVSQRCPSLTPLASAQSLTPTPVGTATQGSVKRGLADVDQAAEEVTSKEVCVLAASTHEGMDTILAEPLTSEMVLKHGGQGTKILRMKPGANGHVSHAP